MAQVVTRTCDACGRELADDADRVELLVEEHQPQEPPRPGDPTMLVTSRRAEFCDLAHAGEWLREANGLHGDLSRATRDVLLERAQEEAREAATLREEAEAKLREAADAADGDREAVTAAGREMAEMVRRARQE